MSTVQVTGPGNDLGCWEAVRAEAERLELEALVESLAVAPGAALVVLSAHPDDETFGLGRLMHRWGRRIGPVIAVVATAGEACVDHVGRRPDHLAERRLAEWRTATDILGVAQRRVLGLPDGCLADQAAELESAVERVLAELTGHGPGVVLAAPWRRDPHPDHRAAGRAVTAVGAALRIPVLEFGVWMTYWSDPAELVGDGRRLAVLNVDDLDDAAHSRACAAFVSQLRPLAPGLGPVVPEVMLAHHHEQLLVLGAEPRVAQPAGGGDRR